LRVRPAPLGGIAASAQPGFTFKLAMLVFFPISLTPEMKMAAPSFVRGRRHWLHQLPRKFTSAGSQPRTMSSSTIEGRMQGRHDDHRTRHVARCQSA
jgi:hypothetical protein